MNVNARFQSTGVDLRKATAKAEHHEDADGDESNQLHRRLERDGCDDTVMLLSGIDVSRAEKNREERHDGGNAKGEADIVQSDEVAAVRPRSGRDGLNGAGDRLQLERNIGRYADDGDQRHEHCEPARLAEPGRQEVGDGGDPLRVADPYQLAQYEPPADKDQCRPEIDGEKFQPIARCRPHCAVEGPARAVDRDR